MGGSEIANTINCFDLGDVRSTTLIVEVRNDSDRRKWIQSHRGDGIKVSETMYCLNQVDRHAVCYAVCAYESNSMKSANPYSGIYETKTSRTLDNNGGNPACNQGGS